MILEHLDIADALDFDVIARERELLERIRPFAQDHHRAVIMGTKSHGKASVQTIFPLKDGSALRLTTSKYFTPSGRSIHGQGIQPDVVVPFQEPPPKEEKEGSKKIVLKINSLKEVEKIESQLKKAKVPYSVIKDAGLTQLKRGTLTALGIGPIEERKVDKITGKLKLL